MTRITVKQRLAELKPEQIAISRKEEFKNFVTSNIHQLYWLTHQPPMSSDDLKRHIYEMFMENGWGLEEVFVQTIVERAVIDTSKLSFDVFWKPENEVWYALGVDLLDKDFVFEDITGK